MHWRIELLGGLRASCGDESIAQFRSRKTAALLAYLAFFRGPHPRDTLVELFWPEAPLEAGRNSLRVALADLQRRSLLSPGASGSAFSPPLLEKDRTTIGLNRSVTTDVEEFETAVAEARRSLETDVRMNAYERARSLYNGVLLPGFYEHWIPAEEVRLEATYVYVLKTLKAFYDQSADSARAFELSCLLDRLESRESLTPRNTSPADIRENPVKIRDVEVVATLDAPVSVASLPTAFTRFFGREGELQELVARLLNEQTRLLTLTGGGGLGKTRLSLELARQVTSFPHAESYAPFEHVYWLALADVTESDRIPEAFIKALNLTVEAAETPSNSSRLVESIADFLRGDSRVLLVLDNFEQLLPAGAAFLGDLLERVPRLVLLVTSRQRLNLSGEWEHRTNSLALPTQNLAPQSADETTWDEQQLANLRESSSVQLFADRARSARSDWRLHPHETPTLIALLHRLEGVPLAIELVASRAGVLSVEQMFGRLSQSLQWVSSRDLHRPARHRSLHAVLEWSLQLLPARERDIFARLSVFHGGWTLEDAAAVLPDASDDELLEALQSLRDASLITSDESIGAELRFSMLEMVRQIAGERLTEDECLTTRRRHAQFYAQLAQIASRSGGLIKGRYALDLTEGLNFLSALDFWMEEDLEQALEIAASLWWYWVFNYHLPEGRHYFRELLDKPSVATFRVAHARAQVCAAYISLLSGYYDEAEQLLQEALIVWRDDDTRDELAGTLNLLGAVAVARGDTATARDFYAQSLERRRAKNTPRELAIAINALAGIERDCGHRDAARLLCEEALELAERNDDQAARSWALYTLGLLAFDVEDWDEARNFQEKSLAIRRRLKGYHAEASCLDALGDIAQRVEDFESARHYYEGALQIWQRVNYPPKVKATLERLRAIETMSQKAI